MKSLILTVVMAVLIAVGSVWAAVEKGCAGGCKSLSSASAKKCADDCDKPCCPKADTCEKACSKNAKCEDAAACKKDCSKCPKADTCEKACAKKCPADCTKPCCNKVDVVMVTVNGEKIMQSVVDERIEPQLQMAKMMGQTPTEAMLDNFRRRVMEGMIREKIMDAKIKELKIKVTDKEVAAKLEEIAVAQGRSVQELIAGAAQQGYTEEKIKEQIKMGMGFDALMAAEAEKGSLEVSEENAKKYYDDNIAQFSSPDEVKASHILCGGRGFDTFDEAKKAEAKKRIEDVYKKLKDGMAFEEAAKQFSDCPSKSDGGDLKSYISADGMIGGRPAMDPTFSAAAHTLKVGEYGDPVKTPFGYHIIKATDKKVAEVKTFADVKDQIIEMQEEKKKTEFAKVYIENLVESAKIVYAEGFEPQPPAQFNPAMAPVRK